MRLIVIVWAATGPIFDYSNTWQLVINTGTTIVTFLMVFLIQRSQNKDSLAIQLKLERARRGHGRRQQPADRLRGLERGGAAARSTATTPRSSSMAKKEQSLTMSHSVEEAEERHAHKARKTKAAKPSS